MSKLKITGSTYSNYPCKISDLEPGQLFTMGQPCTTSYSVGLRVYGGSLNLTTMQLIPEHVMRADICAFPIDGVLTLDASRTI